MFRLLNSLARLWGCVLDALCLSVCVCVFFFFVVFVGGKGFSDCWVRFRFLEEFQAGNCGLARILLIGVRKASPTLSRLLHHLLGQQI